MNKRIDCLNGVITVYSASFMHNVKIRNRANEFFPMLLIQRIIHDSVVVSQKSLIMPINKSFATE